MIWDGNIQVSFAAVHVCGDTRVDSSEPLSGGMEENMENWVICICCQCFGHVGGLWFSLAPVDDEPEQQSAEENQWAVAQPEPEQQGDED